MAEYIERAAVEKMAEQRLIDANKILYHQAWESGSMEPANEGVALMSEVQAMPTIDPETLPIVRQLREELERVTAERDAAVEQLSELECCEFCKHTECIPRGGVGKCEWEWRGLQKED